jgi:hypothetical protein
MRWSKRCFLAMAFQACPLKLTEYVYTLGPPTEGGTDEGAGVVILLIANAVQNAMTGPDFSVQVGSWLRSCW